jgi:hypothetical protein
MESIQAHYRVARRHVSGGSVFPWIAWTVVALVMLIPPFLAAFHIHGLQLPDRVVAAPYFVT